MCIKGEIVRNEKHGLLNRLLIATRILVNVYAYVKISHKTRKSITNRASKET